MTNGNILILNEDPKERDFIAKFCLGIGSVFSAADLDGAISILRSIHCNLVIVNYALASYTRFKDLIKKTTSIIITGTEEKIVKKTIKEWPLECYLEYQVIPPQPQDKSGFLRILKSAMEYSLLKSEVENLTSSIELLRTEMKESYSEIRETMNFIRENFVKELEKHLEIEAKYVGFQQKEGKIEKILKKIYSANDVTYIFDIIYDIKNIVQSEGITIYIVDENEMVGKYLNPLIWDETFLTHKGFSHNIALIGSQDFAASVARYGKEINIADLTFDRRLSKRYTEQTKNPLNSILCVPIMHEKEVIGVMEVYNKLSDGKISKGGFTKEDQEILGGLTEHISIAMTKLNFIQYDALTGLLRPEAFFEKIIQKIISKSKRREEEGLHAMVMGDVDWFKNYNDRNGHEAGNRLLRELAKAFKSSVREEDLLCRYGGEEFLFFLTGIKDMEEACRLTERIRKNVEERYFEYQEFQPKNNLTMSFGLTLFPRRRTKTSFLVTKDELREIINEADKALAKAKGKDTAFLIPQDKKEGDITKNKVCVYSISRSEEEKEDLIIKTYKETFFKDKRKFRRFYTSTIIIYRENSTHKVTKTVNLSLGGAKIISELELPVARALDLILILGDKGALVKAEVVYSRRSSRESPFYYAGLKFKDVPLADKKVLKEYLQSLA